MYWTLTTSTMVLKLGIKTRQRLTSSKWLAFGINYQTVQPHGKNNIFGLLLQSRHEVIYRFYAFCWRLPSVSKMNLNECLNRDVRGSLTSPSILLKRQIQFQKNILAEIFIIKVCLQLKFSKPNHSQKTHNSCKCEQQKTAISATVTQRTFQFFFLSRKFGPRLVNINIGPGGFFRLSTPGPPSATASPLPYVDIAQQTVINYGPGYLKRSLFCFICIYDRFTMKRRRFHVRWQLPIRKRTRCDRPGFEI